MQRLWATLLGEKAKTTAPQPNAHVDASQAQTNPITDMLLEMGVSLPDAPLDASEILRSAGVDRSYAILMPGRTGSTWLGSALCSLEGLGCPAEFFSERWLKRTEFAEAGESFESLLSRLLTQNQTGGCFGFKSNATRLSWLGRLLDVRKSFAPEHCTYIDMRRFNIVAQAASFARAQSTGVWHEFSKPPPAMFAKVPAPVEPQPEQAIDDAQITAFVAIILEQERDLDLFYRTADVEPLRIHYEELYDAAFQTLARVVLSIRPDFSDADALTQAMGGTNKLAGKAQEDEAGRYFLRNAHWMIECESLRRAGDLEGAIGCARAALGSQGG